MSDPSRPVSGFVPIGDMAGAVDLPDGRALPRPATPQARHHFTTLRQVNQLVEASEAEPDLGFMARLLALCSLPRTNPGNREKYIRRNGPHALVMTAGGLNKLPYGILPRLLLAWVCTEAVRTQRRELVLGRSLYEFMQKLGMDSHSGGVRGDRTRLRNQMDRLFGCTVSLIYENASGSTRVSSFVADKHELWWDVSRPDAPVLWESKIELGEKFFNEIIAHPIPLDLNILKRLKRSPLGLDLYMWLTYRTFSLKTPAHPRVETALPAVRRGPCEGNGEIYRPRLPRGLSPRAEENQTRVAGPALPHGDGRTRPLAVAAAHPAGTAPSHQRIGPSGPREGPCERSTASGWGCLGRPVHTRGSTGRSAPRLEFSTKPCDYGSFPSLKRPHHLSPKYR